MAVNTTLEVTVPQMGESVTEGTVLHWYKQEGERVQIDEPLVEISTDKVDSEIPAPATGTVVKIHAAAGATVAVGTVLAEISLDGAGDGASDVPAGQPAAPQGDESAPSHEVAQGKEAQDGDETGTTAQAEPIDIVTPSGGESVTEGTLLEWAAKVGDELADGDTVAVISTDKVDMDLPAPAAGTLEEILVQAGATVTVGQVIGRLRPGATTKKASAAPAGGNGAGHAAAAPSSAPTAPAPPGNGVSASPVAARAAAAEGVDLGSVEGSGPGGRVTKADVLQAAGAPRSGAAAPAVAPGAGATPIRGGAAMLARYMEQSLTVPTATSLRTLTVTTLDARRRELKQAGQTVSFTHLIGYAIALAVGEHIPSMAHHYAEADGQPQRVDDGVVNLGIAVDVERPDGARTLMVPVIRNAAGIGFAGFKAAFDDLVRRARDNELTADDLAGANVTLTNPGGLGTSASVPRLMAGQGTIVATGAIGYPPGLAGIGDMIGAEKVMSVTSTYDHRIIQGAESGRFLAAVDALLQGDHGFYERVFDALGAKLGTLPAPPAPAAAAAAARAQAPAAGAADEELLGAMQAAMSLLKAFRTHGHLAARLDPLGAEPAGDPALEPATVGLTPELMARIPARLLRMHVPGATLADALPHLRETYCGTMAYEIEHIASHRQRVWLRQQIESGAFRSPLTSDEQRALLKRLIHVDAFERFMHKAYLGQKQFSVEGLDMTVPMLDELIQLSAAHGAREVVVGMAHRGRLNVLVHNLGRPYETIFAEFEGASTMEAVTQLPQGGTGDVKYHHGAQGTYQVASGEEIFVNLESNPSHLEFVHPVVLGATRAAQTSRQGPHARRDTNAAVPLVLHGDAAMPGQGVVAEALNLQALEGYRVGGAVHLVQNNQVGFTTDPNEARSTRWASDLAKGFDTPIFHVNADDVAACISAARLAFAFREEFGHDVVIDLIGYRRFGHNEADEPAYTQPEMYAKIKSKKRVSELFADALVAAGVVSADDVEGDRQAIWDKLTELHQALKTRIAAAGEAATGDRATGEYQLDRSPSPEVSTAVSAERLIALNNELLAIPEGFSVHPKLLPQLERRRAAVGADGGIDWAQAEALAFASLVTEGTPIRLTGQDTERGTFSQRHLVLHDATTGQRLCPMQRLPDALAPFEVHNSPLSEIACMGFEYGYSVEAPETLVLWEAQFGDFVNGGQVIIDQFIASGLAKWGQTTRLTLLLPHGYEGSGPEHSSGRLERFLQLAAEGNLRVANLTTPAQYFHLLRRQARVAKQRPLVIMTPKSLLRLSQATNRIEHLSETRFFPVLGEPRVDADAVRRLVLCTGKIYYDLVGHSMREDNPGVAIGRVELLYPFPESQIRELIDGYPNLEEVVWVQEEPRNMGARAHMSPRLMQIMPEHLRFGYIGRPERASPGEGYPAAHSAEQNRILRTALDLSRRVTLYPSALPGER